MAGRWSSVDTRDPQEAADGDYFAALVSARYLQVTTFGRDGRPVPARMRGVAGGGRAYFGARSWSGTVRRLRHASAVRVAPCGMLGVCYGLPLDAIARRLPAGEAGPAATELARKYPARRRSLTRWLDRAWRPKMVHYELVASDATDKEGPGSQGLSAPGQRADPSGSDAARGSGGSGRCQIARTYVTDHGPGSIACLWPVPAQARPRQP